MTKTSGESANARPLLKFLHCHKLPVAWASSQHGHIVFASLHTWKLKSPRENISVSKAKVAWHFMAWLKKFMWHPWLEFLGYSTHLALIQAHSCLLMKEYQRICGRILRQPKSDLCPCTIYTSSTCKVSSPPPKTLQRPPLLTVYSGWGSRVRISM